jgi:hypothetical protein
MSVNVISLKLKLKVMGVGIAAIIGGMTLLNAATCEKLCDHDITKAQMIETSDVVKADMPVQKKG